MLYNIPDDVWQRVRLPRATRASLSQTSRSLRRSMENVRSIEFYKQHPFISENYCDPGDVISPLWPEYERCIVTWVDIERKLHEQTKSLVENMVRSTENNCGSCYPDGSLKRKRESWYDGPRDNHRRVTRRYSAGGFSSPGNHMSRDPDASFLTVNSPVEWSRRNDRMPRRLKYIKKSHETKENLRKDDVAKCYEWAAAICDLQHELLVKGCYCEDRTVEGAASDGMLTAQQRKFVHTMALFARSQAGFPPIRTITIDRSRNRRARMILARW